MRNVLLMTGLAWFAGSVAWSDNVYTVAYEANTMPELDGNWHRYYGAGGATRSIETDGQGNKRLTLDSYSNSHITDTYVHYRQMDPDGPDEHFFCEWRVLISAAHSAEDHGITVAADNGHIINFKYRIDVIWDGFDGWTAPIDPGLYHTYRIESPDMATYHLYIDDTLVRTAQWFPGLLSGYAAFGDLALGGSTGSTSTWDYFRFGVCQNPEPNSLFLVAVGMCVSGVRSHMVGSRYRPSSVPWPPTPNAKKRAIFGLCRMKGDPELPRRTVAANDGV